ncbi:hypothetical protein [Flavisolibacter tropicus]|uniref:Uncharacterized protein n=1 Tax=Flavisolibacter tropicus TaxID=1492898 RepID=A0A172TWA8_9BACT|nr:hypothetical protein [Flavisolibacter tropicus]ANE51164.1 hypothetical protein SY85_12285 [Flavisolibacter tropicus]
MRKALPNRLPLLLLVSLGLLSATLFISSRPSDTNCINTVKCTKKIEKQTIKDGGELLWESLSRQFVASIGPQ